MESVAIVGTGLIGASFGLALRAAGFEGPILGVSSERALAEALAAGAIDRGMPLAEAVGQADLVFLSQTIGRILDTLRHLDPLVRPGALVTDAGSTKCEIVDVARQNISPRPVPGRPSHGGQGDARRGGGRCRVVPRPHLGAHARTTARSWKLPPRASSAAGWSASARAS